MKRNISVNTLAIGNLKNRKKQYALMCVGIILAMVFSSGTLFFLISAQDSYEEQYFRSYGKEDILLFNAEELTLDTPAAQRYLDEIGYAHILGFAYAPEGQRQDGTSIGWLDEKAAQLAYLQLEEGKMPESADEIAIERDALSRLDCQNKKLGDTLTFAVLAANGTEYSETPQNRSYTLVGILNNKRSHLGSIVPSELLTQFLPAAFTAANAQVAAGGKEILTAYAAVSNTADHEFADFYEELRRQDVTDHLLDVRSNYYGRIDSSWGASEEDTTDTLSLFALLALVLTAVSCLGIINAFSTNLRSRRQQIGLLRAVGATRRQIIRVFGREAFLLSLICAPISILLSYFGTKLLLGWMGDVYILRSRIWVLFVCAAIGVACVMLAALLPLTSASRVSPMQAIRQMDMMRKMRRKKIRSQKTYALPKLLAKRDLIFHRGTQTLVSLLLTAAICLACFGFSYVRYAEKTAWTVGSDYAIDYLGTTISSINDPSQSEGMSETDLTKIYDTGCVDQIYADKACSIDIMMEELTPYAMMATDYGVSAFSYDALLQMAKSGDFSFDRLPFSENYQSYRADCGYQDYPLSASLHALHSDVISMLTDGVSDGEIRPEKIQSGEQVILIAPKEIGWSVGSTENGDYYISSDGLPDAAQEYFAREKNHFHAGDKLTLSYVSCDENGEIQKYEREVTIGAVVYSGELPSAYIENSGNAGMYRMELVTDLRAFSSFTGVDQYPYTTVKIYLNRPCDAQLDEYMRTELEQISAGLPNLNLFSKYLIEQDTARSLRQLYIGILALVILGFAVSGSLINNSLSARIRESRRQIGTLRAVGASARELNFSYIRQFLSLYCWGVGIGFALYGLIYGVLWLDGRYHGEMFEMPFAVWESLALCVLLFAVTGVNLRWKIRNQTKDSIIENIREL